MKDREKVAEYMKEFLHGCSYLGFSNVDMSKLTQVFRRIHKSADKVPIKELLDYYVVLALSNAYYKEFDAKSSQFVEEGLDLIEKQFTGLKTIEAAIVDPISLEQETLKLNFFESIPSNNKIYNKVLVENKKVQLNFKKAQDYLENYKI